MFNRRHEPDNSRLRDADTPVRRAKTPEHYFLDEVRALLELAESARERPAVSGYSGLNNPRIAEQLQKLDAILNGRKGWR